VGVLWLGVGGVVQLVKLKASVERALGEGWVTRHYHPHVTLAKGLRPEQQELVEQFMLERPALFRHRDWVATSFYLYGNPGDGGPYRTLAEFPLYRQMSLF